MAGIVEIDPVAGFLDEEEDLSVNDQQANTIKRTFQITRSNLSEYGILNSQKGVEFHGQPAPHAAV